MIEEISLDLVDMPTGSELNEKSGRRTLVDDKGVAQLAYTIIKDGQLQPVALLAKANGRYSPIFGFTRLRAIALINAGFEYMGSKNKPLPLYPVRAIVYPADTSETKVARLRLEENIVRTDISPIDKAKQAKELAEVHGLKPGEIQKIMGLNQKAVSRLNLLLDLPELLQDAISNGRITAQAADLWRTEKHGRTEEALAEFLGALAEDASYSLADMKAWLGIKVEKKGEPTPAASATAPAEKSAEKSASAPKEDAELKQRLLFHERLFVLITNYTKGTDEGCVSIREEFPNLIEVLQAIHNEAASERHLNDSLDILDRKIRHFMAG